MRVSRFDRVKDHLARRRERRPAPEALREDVELVVRRCEEFRSLRQVDVELSPYMRSLLRVSGMEGAAQQAQRAQALAAGS